MFIAKDNDLIILARDTREELEQALRFMVYTDIEETDIEYELYGGQYLTPEEVEVKKAENINRLTMTALDFITAVKNLGVTDSEIESYLNNNLNVKHQLQFCQNVYCGVAKALTPVTLGGVTITPEMVEAVFIAKNKQ